MTEETQSEYNRRQTPPVTAGWADRSGIARELQVGERTVIRYEEQGMPVIRVGKKRWYDRDAVRAWLLSHQVNQREPNGRGRPRKHSYQHAV